MDVLVFLEGAQKGQRYPLNADRITLGRDRRNDIPIDDGASSRMHADIIRKAGGLFLRDNNSTNGTYLNSRRVTETAIRSGDRISIGDAVAIVESTDTGERPQIFVSDAAHDMDKNLTVALDSTSLFNLEDIKPKRDQELREQFLSLFNFMTEISGLLEMDRLLPRALAEMASNLGADRGAILFVSKTDELRPQVVWPEKSVDVVVSRSIAEKVLETKQGMLSNPSSDRGKLRRTTSITMRDVGSVLCAPLKSEDRVLGLVYFETGLSSIPFTEQNLRLLSCMAMQLAISVQNAGFYKSLRNAEEFSSCILSSMTSGLLIIDERDIIIRANDAACRILSLTQKDIAGLPLRGDGRLQQIANLVDRTRQTGIPIDHAEVTSVIDGNETPLGVSTSSLEDFTGKAIGVVATFRDMTHLKRLADEVKRSQRLASLGEMAAGIAHEVRNPLNSVYGFAQLLQEDARKHGLDEGAQYAGFIQEEVQRINRIVQDMLDFSRQQELTMGVVHLQDMLDSLVKQLAYDASGAKVSIIWDYASCPAATIMGNSDKLRQMFLNIMRNAIQACAEGGRVTVMLEVGHDSHNVYPEAVISISDDGCGIAEDELDKIFNPFFTTKDVGTGLGLAICQKIVEQHSGGIEALSSPGLGTTFRIRMPMREM